jgi:hypothetical protein
MFSPLFQIISRRGPALALASVAVALSVTASASAQQPPVEPTAAEAAGALDEAQAALAPEPGATGAVAAADPSVALNQLAAGYSELGRADRRQARGLLARPSDGAADRYGDGYPDGAPVATAESEHFCVFWVNAAGAKDAPDLTDANANGVPDYVESILSIAEYSYTVEVTPSPLGWQPPKPDKQGCGSSPATHSDLYLKQIGNKGLFGYESPDEGQGNARSQYGYMVLDNDYSPSEFPGFANPTDPASVTFAHEFNHLLQQNYDSFEDVWMFESTAVWTEEQVYPQINDWVNYVPSFAQFPGEPITATFPSKQEKSLRIYGTGVFNHWLDSGGGGFGVGVIRNAWEVSGMVSPHDFSLSSYDRAIHNSGGSGFSPEFVSFAAATAEWRSGFGGFPDHTMYPDVKRKGKLTGGGKSSFKLDHTAYRLLDIQPGGNKPLKLIVDADHGTRVGLALIARTGDPLTGGVTEKVRYLASGGRGSVTLASPATAERITAVIVNADGRVKGFAGRDWNYTRDGVHFDVSLSR